MTNPETTQTQAPKTEKKVKIKTIRDCLIGGKIVVPGQVVEATEAEAKEFCDTTFPGYMNFSGERYQEDGDIQQQKIVRAVRVG